ncbi:phospho-N-acetylmuramoyl-pentapeptide-transferase [Candidatus Omnitrophus magneticus]|uniref:Phospho-N-acetylmuramoyl-pentapeptide-transferase n=1 Tax=Candidatus Omnitrophus magneticus TaxID=1609969 RepID=A0A0F0CSQ3_9BACT|nr:phospho-N-acetylmuramoyl-pentapeptide-transferase [Candidatus Omnitrophus magneticus]
MFYHIFYSLKNVWFGFNIFKYITFRAGMAAVTAFLICIFFGPIIIRGLRMLSIGQYVRKEHVVALTVFHNKKEGTPTMGGILIIIAVICSTLLWARLDNDYVILAMGSMVWMGAIGFIDDCIKLKNKSAKGIRAKTKIIGQTILALIVGIFVVKNKYLGTQLYLPFLKDVVFNLGIFYLPFIWFVIVGVSNAVNLTDGLDGLAIGCTILTAITYAIISYMAGNFMVSKYLNIFYLPGAGELTCFLGAMVGAGLGFLWFNAHPAEVFMGDTGSLSLGSALATVSILIKKEILLAIVGGIFLVEAVSVMIQVFSYKTRKKRVFLMTPIHHHFQIKGWAETKITVRFWIVASILALLGIVSLKIM